MFRVELLLQIQITQRSFYVFEFRNYFQGLSVIGLVVRQQAVVHKLWDGVVKGVRKLHFHTLTCMTKDVRISETN